jgi:phosphoglycolate phosphatase
LASCRAALRDLGHEPGAALDIAAIIGPPMEDAMRLLLKPYRDDRVDEAVAAYRKDYGVSGLFESKLYPGVADALRGMREANVRLYLATSKRTIFARRILEHQELATYFDGIYGSEPGGTLDHKPELIAHILSQHGLQPECGVMVGDRRYDISGAHANRMHAVGVLWGYSTNTLSRTTRFGWLKRSSINWI